MMQDKKVKKVQNKYLTAEAGWKLKFNMGLKSCLPQYANATL